MDVTASALMIHWETIAAVSRQQQVILVGTKGFTCVCLPFSGASLVGREEYMVEDSPSFLGSTGLFGLRGKPRGKEKIDTFKNCGVIKKCLLCLLCVDGQIKGTHAFVKDQLQLPGFAFLVTELPLKVTQA